MDGVDLGHGEAEPVFTAHLQQMRLLPITLFMRACVMVLGQDGHLRISTGRGVLIDEGPVSQFHSYRPSAVLGFHLWHGARRFRFVLWNPPSGAVTVVGRMQDLPGRMATERSLREQRDLIGATLGARIAPAPPSGVTVRRPFPTWALWLVVVGVTLAIMGIVTVIVLAGR